MGLIVSNRSFGISLNERYEIGDKYENQAFGAGKSFHAAVSLVG